MNNRYRAYQTLIGCRMCNRHHLRRMRVLYLEPGAYVPRFSPVSRTSATTPAARAVEQAVVQALPG